MQTCVVETCGCYRFVNENAMWVTFTDLCFDLCLHWVLLSRHLAQCRHHVQIARNYCGDWITRKPKKQFLLPVVIHSSKSCWFSKCNESGHHRILFRMEQVICRFSWFFS